MTGNTNSDKRILRRAWRASGYGFSALALLAAVGSCAVPGPRTYVPAEQQSELQRARAAYLAHDYQEAEPLLRKLADAGNADAQYVVGYMYYYGQGVKKDFVAALEYISLASANGHPTAKQALQRLADQYENAVRFCPSVGKQQTPSPSAQSQTVQTLRSKPAPYPPPATSSAAATASRFEVSNPARTGTGSADSHEPLRAVPAGTTKKAGVMAQPPGNYTIQLLAAQDAKTIDDYMTEHALRGRVSRFGYRREGQYWYVMVYGSYPTFAAARAALSTLDRKLLAPSPWIRKYADIQYALVAGAGIGP